MNTVIWKDQIKNYDICVVQTDYSAIIMNISHTTWNNLSESASWLGGIKNLDEAKQICIEYIDEDIALENKMKRAKQAYDAVMAG